MLDSLETYWHKVFSELDRGGGPTEGTDHGGKMVYEPGIADRRGYRRYTYEVVVECRVQKSMSGEEEEERFPALTQNVSKGGLALLSNKPITSNQTIDVRFTHSGNGYNRYHVCWSKKTKEGTYLSGLKQLTG